ncbi:hypothetical protein EOT10_11865 [Streptomyces antnestii]|uniref:Lipoprotein n=1 Tax=Streptomyces antnestii TaxID=2494256 RepID=A0A3S2VYR4_9ACTN|nr:hypothetical protein [Streptomyces sp. San01]RVU26257.1 hypothetical protein EOT10_11865 [Streptomyces sp. San01]
MTRRVWCVRVTGTAFSLAALSLAALTGCGTHGDGVPRTATGSLEQLAARAGCRPDIQTDAEELRQATCGDGRDRYVLTTFATDRGRAAWLDQADDYGGTYLLGRRWVAVGADRVVTRLRGRLGGTVERSGHAGHHAS